VREPTNKSWKATMLGRDPTKHLHATFTYFKVAKTLAQNPCVHLGST